MTAPTPSEETDFQRMLKIEAVCREFSIQQYQYEEKTVELMVNDGGSVRVWQYPESYWNRYLAWKEARTPTS